MSPSSGYTSPSSYGPPTGYGLAGAGAGYAAGKASSLFAASASSGRKASDTLEQIKAALIGFATAKVKEFMTEALPGFNQHLDEAERRHQEFTRLAGSTGQHSPSYGQGTSEQQRSDYGSGQSGSMARASSLENRLEPDRQEPGQLERTRTEQSTQYAIQAGS